MEVPTAQIATLGAILSAILAISQAVVPKIVDSFISSPKERAETVKNENDFELKILQQAIKGKTPKDRANAIKLFINSGLLKDPEGKLLKQVETPDNLPEWDGVASPSPNSTGTPKPETTTRTNSNTDASAATPK